MTAVRPRAELSFRPATPGRWNDLERLFGPRGAYSGCWCMYWRVTRSEFDRNGNPGNRRAMRDLVAAGRLPGILAFEGGTPIGWVSVAPRDQYGSLERSRTLKRVDDRPVWSVVCFFIARPYRRQGLMSELLEAAVDHARRRGASVVEGYPVEPHGRKLSGGGEAYVGIRSAFVAAGFEEVGRGGMHAIMRRVVREPVDEQAVVGELRRMADPSQLDGMARFGIRTEDALGGIRSADLERLSRRYRPDHDLALRLWATGVHEARLLAAIVDDPLQVTEEQMERWVADFDSWDVCDTVCGKLFDRTPFAYEKVAEWTDREEEFVKRAGFALLAWLAVHDKESSDRTFERSLPAIRRGATDERNFVKKAVSWALRQIGKRDVGLHRMAVELARTLTASSSSAARWVGRDALRELSSRKIRARLER